MGKRIATEEKQTELIQEIHNLNQEILSVSEYKNAAQAAATTATTKASEASTSAAAAAASASDADTTATALTTWLADKEELTAPVVDPALTISGAAADAKVVGDQLNPVTIPSVSWEDEQFVNSNGVIVANESYSVATVLGWYDTLHIATYVGASAGISFFDADDNYINGFCKNGSNDWYITSVKVPQGTAKTLISCQTAQKTNFKVYTTMAEIQEGIENTLETKVDLPSKDTNVTYTVNQGIMRNNLTVYNPSDTYAGRYTQISVNEYDTYKISGYALNTYPCAMTVDSNNFVTTLLGGSAQAYVDAVVQIPKNAVTLYVNGRTQNPVNIKKVGHVSQEDFVELISGAGNYKPLKAKVGSSSIIIKKKYDATRDICIEFANVGGNNLWNFSRLFYVANPNDYPNDDFTPSTIWSMSGSDWIGPYIVAAVNNITGDNPDSSYFTGGNHRTTNASTGGGVTATQQALSIKIDGVFAPQEDVIYACRKVVIAWENAVQAYNTSLADGSGRAVLTENWEMSVDDEKIALRNTITALEDIVLSTYYGFQATCSGKNFKYIGGTNRDSYVIGTDLNKSGNNTCRTVVLWDTNFNCEITVEPVDLGLFEHNNGNSFSPSTGKMYAQLVIGEGNEINIGANEQYYLEGSYRFL